MELVLNTFGACLTKDNDGFMALHKERFPARTLPLRRTIATSGHGRRH